MCRLALLSVAFLPAVADAHVKWFAPYDVGAVPRPIRLTLTNGWFWTGVLLALGCFLATRWIEKGAIGEWLLRGLDRLTEPLRARLDDFVLCLIGAFFVALFALGGVYLTPELITLKGWVPWLQLLIAGLLFFPRLRFLAALGILSLWWLASREYNLFHLFDYLSLGCGVAAYLILQSSANPSRRAYRFEAYAWGIAIALMWSSLEKFAYPQWFYPLIADKPYLTLGIPRDPFIPMAGVAEFTFGLGLVWTPLVRRLSAIALLIIFNTAVLGFGRIDLVGHALIMAGLIAITVQRSRESPAPAWFQRSLSAIPLAMATGLLVFFSGYWGLHQALFSARGRPLVEGPFGRSIEADRLALEGRQPDDVQSANRVAMQSMDRAMMAGMMNPDPDRAFIEAMIPHHQGAVDMALIELKYGRQTQQKLLARAIIDRQKMEIQQMQAWLRAQKSIKAQKPTQ